MKFTDLFIPTKENDHTPHLLQKAAMMMMVVLTLLSFTAVNIQALFWQSSDWLVGTVLPAVVVDLTNSERADIAAVPLKRNALLDQAAKLKAEHMAKNSYFAHYSPNGVSPWFWFEQVDYVYAHAGENLAIHFNDSDAVVEAWMKSPSHKANIVNNDYTEIGVGTARGTYDGFDTVYVVQLFGTPAQAAAPVAPTPTSAPAPAPITPPVAVTIPETGSLSIETTDTQTPELVAGEQAPEEVEVIEESVVAVSVDTDLETPKPAALSAPIEVADVYRDTQNTSVFSTHFATSSGLAPMALDSVSGSTATQASLIGSIATKPNSVLQFLYLLVGLFVASLLLSSIVIGIKYERPLQIVYGLGLLLLMSALFQIQVLLTTPVVIAAELPAATQN